MKKYIQILFFVVLCTGTKLYAQTVTENWVPVYSDNEKSTYVNISGLSAFQDNEIMVWVMEEMISPLKMEEISDDIYKVKSYYMISKETKRYSLVDIIYYSEKGNVIKFYHYDHNYDNQEFKYTSPIMAGSEMEKVFARCLETITSSKSSN